MSHDISDELTQLLALAGADDPIAKDQLFRMVYQQLRDVASRLIARGQRGDLQTTALVNELFLKLERGQHFRTLANRKIFFAVSIRAMQQILIDHGRHRRRSVDGHPRDKAPLDTVLESLETRANCEFDSLLEALHQLETESPRQHAVVTYRFFAGLSYPQIAELLGVSVGTCERDWRLARAKLYRLLHAREATDC